MKKFYVTFAIALIMILALSSFSLAVGMPKAHGISGAAFGGAVAALARTGPGALVAHVSGRMETEMETEMEAGMPDAHGLTGAEFGEAVSGLATTDPGALVAHVRGI